MGGLREERFGGSETGVESEGWGSGDGNEMGSAMEEVEPWTRVDQPHPGLQEQQVFKHS